MKINFKENITSLTKSAINNRVLFTRRKNSFLAPIIILLLAVFMMFVPSYLSLSSLTGKDLLKSFPNANEALSTLLTTSLDCKIENSKFVCSEDAIEYNVVVGENVKYTIIANQTTIAQDTSVSFGNTKDTDNLIILLENSVRFRYTSRDLINEEIQTNELLGTYSKLEGYDFKEVAAKLASNPELIEQEVESFTLNIFTSTMNTRFYTSLYSSSVAILLFVLVSSLILKGPSLLKWKKGFKYIECLKISLTSALPALIIATISSFILPFDFSLVFGLIYLVRIVYIYMKYIISKNSIYDELYEETHEERFKMK